MLFSISWAIYSTFIHFTVQKVINTKKKSKFLAIFNGLPYVYIVGHFKSNWTLFSAQFGFHLFLQNLPFMHAIWCLFNYNMMQLKFYVSINEMSSKNVLNTFCHLPKKGLPMMVHVRRLFLLPIFSSKHVFFSRKLVFCIIGWANSAFGCLNLISETLPSCRKVSYFFANSLTTCCLQVKVSPSLTWEIKLKMVSIEFLWPIDHISKMRVFPAFKRPNEWRTCR